MNVFSLCGRVEGMPVLRETPQGVKMATVDVRIQRPFANSEGIYESDVLPLEVWRGLAETICHVAQPGSWISAKGRIASRAYTKDDKQYMNYSFVVERMDVLPVA